MITVRYFARYRECLGVASEQYPEEGVATVGELCVLIRGRHSLAGLVLDDPRCIVAVNHVVVHGVDGFKLQDGNEVAFFPPVTGG